jgi:hypothetical protein
VRLDRSFIAIRQRSMLETLDLALKVFRRYAWQLLAYLIIGSAPFGVLNFFLTSGFPFESGQNGWMNLLLVLAEAQLGTIFVTSFLGQAMFVGDPKTSVVVREVLNSWASVFYLHGFLRCAGMVIGLVAIVGIAESIDGAAMLIWFAGLSAALGVLVRVFRPFVTEILILEKAPLRKKKPAHEISFGKRSQAMHGPIAGEAISIGIAMFFFSVPLLVSFYGTLSNAFELIGVPREVAWFHSGVLWQSALWLVAGFWAIAKFLFYIETRIQQEGWEVELKIRAASIKLAGEAL